MYANLLQKLAALYLMILRIAFDEI